ncbi:hypothetical protein GCM10022218_02420 [Sphingobacterium ginsenosidimutans]|uniref:Uncharacterized protein n=1 Tax=Sphingobacterium ginsenosidimutans TaxID=687845 RepID=A0ABP7ZQL0_9SPHI
MSVTRISDEDQYVCNMFICSVLWFVVDDLYPPVLFYDLSHKMATMFNSTFGLSKTQSSLNTKPK